ncbi:MAG: DUF4124 domain-containing protein [Betaproteobacteria bacterium]|nr:DUF4124 domain-containing protein [Betaproteobacteria bacterium]
MQWVKCPHFPPFAGFTIYRHVDEKGNITFSDRPAKAHQTPEKQAAPNVASPEVSRQLAAERRAMMRRAEEEHQMLRRGRAEREAAEMRPTPPLSRGSRYDPNLPDSQRPEDTSRRSFQ